jgi:hypothetical protein
VSNTWAEFKKSVEAQGVKDETPIAWIDCGAFFDEITVHFAEDGEAEIY